MPHCENNQCHKQLSPEHVRESRSGKLLCGECIKVTPLHPNQQVMGRDFDYSIGYNQKDGLRAHVSLGGAKLSFEVSQQELTRTFGPEQ